MDFKWPKGYKMAVCLTWDLDGESAPYVRNPVESKNQLSELTQRRYGPTVAMKKVLKMLDKHNLPGTFYVPGYIAQVYKDLTKTINKEGHSIGLHGYLHESLDTLNYKSQEEEILIKSKEVINNILDYEPQIYRSPSWELNRWTPELLAQNNILSDSSLMDDEVPYLLNSNNESIIEIPIQWILDDAEYWMHTKANRQKPITDPETVFNIWSKEFDGYYQSGGCYVLTLHPFVSGRWVYMQTVERLIQYIKEFPDVWWTDMDELTEYCSSLKMNNELAIKELPPGEPLKF